MIRYLSLPALVLFSLVLVSCSSEMQQSPFISAEPVADSVQTRSPRTLRLYFEQLPDVPRSDVTLNGPTGELNLRGLHTMGANDLMMEINDQVPDGEYTVQWRTYMVDGEEEFAGSFGFTVQAE